MFKLALVAGHYLGTAGKRCPKKLDPNETREWWLNNRIVSKIEKNLEAYDGIEILRIDDPTGKTDIPLATRVAKGNNWGADFWLSIHANAADLPREVETFDGGGIVAYVHTNASEESKEWQRDLYKASINETGLKGNRATPIAAASHYETRNTKMPAVLMECGFMNSTVDCPIILTEKFANGIAKACTDVIVKRAGLKKKAVTTKPSVKVSISLPVLTKGAKHDAVKTLQSILNARGFTDASEKSLAVDGSFGPATQYALKTFQDSTHKLKVDGICGEETWKALLYSI